MIPVPFSILGRLRMPTMIGFDRLIGDGGNRDIVRGQRLLSGGGEVDRGARGRRVVVGFRN